MQNGGVRGDGSRDCQCMSTITTGSGVEGGVEGVAGGWAMGRERNEVGLVRRKSIVIDFQVVVLNAEQIKNNQLSRQHTLSICISKLLNQ